MKKISPKQTYRTACRLLESLTPADAARLARSGNPAVREAASLIKYMHNDPQVNEPARFAQHVDTIIFYATERMIRKELARGC